MLAYWSRCAWVTDQTICNAKEKKWEFYQLSYTHKMKSKTEYIRFPHVDHLKKQVDTYKRFKALSF